MGGKKGSYFLYTDGGSRGNPGPAGAGWMLLDPEGQIIAEGQKYLGIATNNQAEYKALVLGLKEAARQKVLNLMCFLDSELIVKQLQGTYKVKSTGLKPLYQKVIALLSKFVFIDFSHIPREKNSSADRLANQAMDAHKKRNEKK